MYIVQDSFLILPRPFLGLGPHPGPGPGPGSGPGPKSGQWVPKEDSWYFVRKTRKISCRTCLGVGTFFLWFFVPEVQIFGGK